MCLFFFFFSFKKISSQEPYYSRSNTKEKIQPLNKTGIKQFRVSDLPAAGTQRGAGSLHIRSLYSPCCVSAELAQTRPVLWALKLRVGDSCFYSQSLTRTAAAWEGQTNISCRCAKAFTRLYRLMLPEQGTGISWQPGFSKTDRTAHLLALHSSLNYQPPDCCTGAEKHKHQLTFIITVWWVLERKNNINWSRLSSEALSKLSVASTLSVSVFQGTTGHALVKLFQ